MPSHVARKTVLLVHILASLGLFGAVAAFVVLAIAGLIDTAELPVRAAYWAGGLVTWWLVLPLAIAALATGLLSSLVSPWGLFRHYWVVVKLALTMLILAVLILHAFPISFMAERAEMGGFGTDDMLTQRRQLLLASTAGLVAIFAVGILSVFKPRGLTRYGWRKQREAAVKTDAEP